MSLKRIAVVAALVASLQAGAMTPVGAGGEGTPGREGAVVRTDAGLVRGNLSTQDRTFSGIPYAAPPIGEDRWTPPRRPGPWRGVRDATEPGSPCPLLDGEAQVAGEEDCLYLNVTTPRRARPGKRLPVMVWFHGGGFQTGAGSEYGGARLATEGEVMVVTVNYRLGPLGFLSSPALEDEGGASGTYGLQDQQAALQWVQRNAAGFGGDPGNVTVFGQSAGSMSVCAHLGAPGSRGLFHKAIAQSGPCANAFLTKPVADERGATAIAELGCDSSDDVGRCLRDRPVEEVLATLSDHEAGATSELSDRPWSPVVGTPVLPRQPIDAIDAGASAGIPLMLGSNRDEMRPFVWSQYEAGGAPMTAAEYRAVVEETFGADAGEVLARYPVDDHSSPGVALATVLTDRGANIGACPTLQASHAASPHAPVFTYELAEDSGVEIDGFPFGAFHGWELPFLWDLSIPESGYPELTPEQQELSRQMIAYWTTFARTGAPSSPEGVEWEDFGAGSTTLSLASGPGGIAPVDFAGDHQCDFWLSR